MKVALVYDRVNKWGGAERVLLTLHKMFPGAPLYTSIYDPQKAPWAKVFEVRTSFLQNFPFATRHELYAVLMPLVFESFSFDEYDLVISITSEAAKGIITKPQTKHICYCLTPTRYLWSGYNEYFRNPVLKFLSKPAVWYLKFWDKIAAQRPDKFIAISKEVQKRIKRYYGRDSEVIYPPVDLARSQPHVSDDARRATSLSERRFSKSKFYSDISSGSAFSSSESALSSRFDNEYFLIVSRLVPYKKIDLAVRSFNQLGLPLKIIGTGSELNRLRNMAKSNIEFLGNLTDEKLVMYYKKCRALIFPGLEDFGLTIIEAQSFGKPVIAFGGGGSLETLVEGKTGVFFSEHCVENLIKAIEKFESLTFDSKDCIMQSEKLSFEIFKKEFMRGISNLTV